MARYKRLEVYNSIQASGVVPLYYNPDASLVIEVVNALCKGGARIFEFTNRGDFAHEVFAELNKWCADECPELVLGVGTVVDPATAALYIQLGANFIVSPSLNPDIAKICNRRKVAWIPGAATLSEINLAEELGCEIVKIFPGGEVGGPSFVKAVTGPSPWTQLMPSGGVKPTEENLRAWFEAGAFCVGMGSNLVTTDIIKSKDFNRLTNHMIHLVELVSKIRESLN